MEHKGSVSTSYWRRVVWVSSLTIAACALLISSPSAQQSAAAQQSPGAQRPRLNGIIAAFEKGEPAFNGEAWEWLPDLESNPFAYPAIEQGMRNLRPPGSTRPIRTPVVRLPYKGRQDFSHLVQGFLDQGVMGIILPHVDNPEEALKLVRSMRYPAQKVSKGPRDPFGLRGYNASIAAPYWGLADDENEYARRSDVWPLNPEGELLAIAQIEHIDAVKNIRAILSVPGLGGIMIGQSDLTMSMGLGTPAAGSIIYGAGKQDQPEVQAAIAQVGKVCAEMKKLCGSFQGEVQTRLAEGFKLFSARRPVVSAIK